eukprot:m.16812 g.16812  ORF g.16812 m.16812 type:complete len:510 (-) comp4675_c0_seq1:131-1660(-)
MKVDGSMKMCVGIVAVTIVVVVFFVAVEVECRGDFSKHDENIFKFHQSVPTRIAASPALRFDTSSIPRRAPISSGLHVRPTEFGGDPTGVKDSTNALNMAIQVCINQSTLSPNGYFPGQDSFPDGLKIGDMGGCFVDLDGGEFKISSSLVIPEFNANMNFGFGSIVASKSFPTNDFLIVIGKEGSCNYPQGSCNIDLNFPNLFMDGASTAAGCMQINNVMGVTIGAGSYFLNFTQFGIQINDGHEVMIERCWLGETNFDFDYVQFNTRPNATAIAINGNDHYVLNTIVFSSKVGVVLNGAALVVYGTHVWFPANKALYFNDTMAFHITDGGNRLHGCYIDGGRAVFEGSGLSRNTWMNGFECCAGSGLGGIPHGIMLRGNTIGPGLRITNNIFGGGSIWYEPTSSNAQPAVVDSVIEYNSFSGNAKGTRVSRTLSSTSPQSSWNFNLCDVLALPVVSSVSVSLIADTQYGFPRSIVRPVQGCNVTVDTDSFAGSVTINVDSSTYDNNFV